MKDQLENNIDLKSLSRGGYEKKYYLDGSNSNNVYDFEKNILNQYGLIHEPVVDQNYLSTGGQKPIWPGNKEFAVCLTHDVDNVSQFSLKQSFRSFKKVFYNSGKFVEKAKKIKKYKFKSFDPSHRFEDWLKVEDSIGAKSTFFFYAGYENIGKRHHTDCIYKLSDNLFFEGSKISVGELIFEIYNRGWEIGLHPSWYSFDDKDEMKHQKCALEKIIKTELVSVRQHFLHFDVMKTPLVQSEVGFKYDSTMGFNNNVGFRLGTSYPQRLINLNNNKNLNIVEIPLIIQDGAMLQKNKGMKLDNDSSYELIKSITDKIRNVGGVLTLLWHPDRISDEIWWKSYVEILGHLKTLDPYWGTIQQIGDYWTEENPLYKQD